MKKIICIAAAMLCALTAAPFTASAIEAGTYADRREKTEQQGITEFPDPEAKYTVVTEGDLEFRLYDEFALLSDCKNTDITAVEIPAAVKELPVVGCAEEPFRFCRRLTEITLPDSFTHFRWDRLINTFTVAAGSDEEPMPSVEKVTVSETNPHFTAADGILYSKDMKTLIGCPPALGIKELNLPAETDTIGDYAFFACLSLETAVIPAQIKHIHCNAFTACLNLKTAELPESITTISGDMFLYCKNLTKVVCHGIIDTIGYGAFNCCAALKEFEIPETVTQVGWKAFDESGLTETADGLQYVQNWLTGCDGKISKAPIRSGTKGIAEMTMLGQTQLAYIEVPASAAYFGVLSLVSSPADVPAVIRFRGSALPELAAGKAKNLTDIYIYNPDCAIFDSEKTLPAAYAYEPDTLTVVPIDAEAPQKITGDTVIHGYAGSTAQKYAEKYSRKFEVIEPSGDLNADGETKISDIVMMQKYLLSEAIPQIENWKSADLNKDGRLDAADLSLMKQKLLNPEPEAKQ